MIIEQPRTSNPNPSPEYIAKMARIAVDGMRQAPIKIELFENDDDLQVNLASALYVFFPGLCINCMTGRIWFDDMKEAWRGSLTMARMGDIWIGPDKLYTRLDFEQALRQEFARQLSKTNGRPCSAEGVEIMFDFMSRSPAAYGTSPAIIDQLLDILKSHEQAEALGGHEGEASILGAIRRL